MGPSSPISELDRKNVTLICHLESGYPKTLSRVNWYMDGNLLKRLPDCPTDQNPNPNLELCDDIDPSRLLLEHAGADQASRELNGTVTDSQEIKVDNTQKRKSSEILSEIQQENQRLKEARTCKICMDNEIEVALYPCGHLVSCVNCSFHLIDCPVCRKFIKRIVRTYMS